MSAQTFKLHKPAQIHPLIAYLTKRLETGPVRVTVSRSPSRTHEQLAYLHVAIRELADHVGTTESDLKEFFKSTYGPKTTIRLGDKEVEVPKSVSEYSTLEAAELIEHVTREAAECGLLLEPEAA